MPSNINSLRSTVQHALANKIISAKEADHIVKQAKQDGISQNELGSILNALKEALDGGLDLSTATRRRSLNKLLAGLNIEQQVPGLQNSHAAPPVGSRDLISLFRAQYGSQPDEAELPAQTYNAATLDIADDGSLSIDNALVNLQQTPPSQKVLDALFGVQRAGQMEGLSSEAKKLFADQLISACLAQLPIANDMGAGKAAKTIAITAQMSIIDRMTTELNSSQLDQLLEVYTQLPTPMAKSLLHRALDKADKSPGQTQKFADLKAPEAKDDLLNSWDKLRDEEQRIGWSTTAKGPAAQFALSAMAFCKQQSAIDNVFDGMKIYKDLNKGGASPWDKLEVYKMNGILTEYVEKYPHNAFVFGTFAKDAPKEVAKVSNSWVQLGLSPLLDAVQPSFDDVPLTPDQAEFVKTLLSTIKDDSAVADIGRAMTEASLLLSSKSRGWGTPDKPEAPMGRAAFAQFKQVAAQLLEKSGETETGMIDSAELRQQVQSNVAELRKNGLYMQMERLDLAQPRWGDFPISALGAESLKNLLSDHLRSGLSFENIDKALSIVAAANGQMLDDTAMAQFTQIVNDYQSQWPDKQLFDYNKLGRFASYQVKGLAVPMSRINSKEGGRAEFNGQVAKAVRASIDRSSIRHEWMADRWAMRATESLEMLDMIGQQTSEGLGPIHKLNALYPGRKITVKATGLDGGHQRFLYQVEGKGTFNQGSDGTISRYNGRRDPVLFSAGIANDGSLDVKVPQHNQVRKYPIQNTYEIGDSVDWGIFDPSVEEIREEGKNFTTKNKIVQARITAYDAKGNYQLHYIDPHGQEQDVTVPLGQIRKLNTPHYFSLKSSNYSDVSININSDPALKTFVTEAQPIINKYLPSDGSLLGLGAAELTKRQKACIKELQKYVADRIEYPAHKGEHIDAKSKKYWDFDSQWRFPLGELAEIGRGVCRHQCIFEHLLLQQAGIDSRLSAGAGNTGSGKYRGLHIWSEVSLADGGRYLSDQTWGDPFVPLWNGAYDRDKRRTEIYTRTARYDNNMVS